jgi:DNA modification methylase
MSKEKLIWHTEKRKVGDLVPFSKNPRILTEKQLSDLKRSLKKFDLVEVPVIDTDNTILVGHQRLKVMQLLGRGEEVIDVRVASRKLTKEEFDQYLLTSNRLHADWDFDILRNQFSVDTMIESGFDDMDLGNIFDEMLSAEDDGWDQEEELKKVKDTIVKAGDMYQLGNHFIICGSNQDPEVVKRLVGKNRIDVVNVDPPYNLSINYDKGISGRMSYGGTTNDKKSDADYREFLKNILSNSIAVSKENAHYFMWCDEKKIGLLQELYREVGIEEKRLCYWLKNNLNATPKIAFNKITETCLYGVRGTPYLSEKLKNLNEVMNKEVSSGNRLHDDILDMLNIWLVRRIAADQYDHPTQKDPTLYEKSLRRCSKPGDNILDLCGGSGSVLLSAESLKRRAFLCEVEPVFVQLTLSRYEKATGIKAKKLA